MIPRTTKSKLKILEKKLNLKRIERAAVVGVLALAIATPATAPAAVTEAPESCVATDHRCHAREWEHKAKETEEPKQRALYLHAAHLAYLTDYQQRGEARSICTARRLLERSIKIRGQPADQRRAFEATRGELDALAGSKGIHCRSRSKGPKVAGAAGARPQPPVEEDLPPLLPLEEPAPQPVDDGRDADTTEDDAVGPAARETEVLEGSTVLDGPEESPAGSTARSSTNMSDAPGDDAPRRRARGKPWIIAGAGLVGAGLGLTGLATYAGLRTATVTESGFNWVGSLQAAPTEEALREDDARRADYYRWSRVTLGTAIGAGVALIAGSTLLAIGVRRHRRRQELALVPGGLVLRGRF